MIKRGDLVTVALLGDYGKPRPALVIPSDLFAEHPSVTVLPVTSELRDTPLFRIPVEPSAENNLRSPSQVMNVSEPIWVLDAVVEAIRKRQLAEHGGGTGIR